MATLGRRTNTTKEGRWINILGKNYCSQENSVKVSKIDDSFFFEAREDNVNNTMKFRIEHPIGNLHQRRLLRNDHNGGHIVTLRKKIRSIHNTWEAFNEDESDRLFTAKECLFTAKESGHRKKKLEVFLKSKKLELEVTGTYSERTFKVQDVNQLNFIIAEMGEDGKVIVNRNIDYAFIVALIMIQDALA